MTEAPDRSRQDLCDAILRYLQTHPQAADSLEGIARWWLGEGSISSLEAVQGALDHLVGERRIARLPLADGRTLYQSVDKTSGQQAAMPPDQP